MIVPVTINYEKVIYSDVSDNLSTKLPGKFRLFWTMFKQIINKSIFGTNFGQIRTNFAQPFSVQVYLFYPEKCFFLLLKSNFSFRSSLKHLELKMVLVSKSQFRTEKFLIVIFHMVIFLIELF